MVYALLDLVLASPAEGPEKIDAGGGGWEQDSRRCVHLGPQGGTSLGNDFFTDAIIHHQVMVS